MSANKFVFIELNSVFLSEIKSLNYKHNCR
jgi:hypothetical protein